MPVHAPGLARRVPSMSPNDGVVDKLLRMEPYPDHSKFSGRMLRLQVSAPLNPLLVRTLH